MAIATTQLDRDALQEQVHEVVRQLLGELGSTHALAVVRAEAHLERELGLGSLERVELLLRLGQTFGVELPEQAVAEADTLEDLGQAVLRAAERAAAQRPAMPEIFSAAMARVRRHAGPAGAVTGREVFETSETLVEALERHARRDPHRPHIFLREDPVSGETPAEPHLITYGTLYEQALKVAQALAARGLGPKQTVALMLPTCREFFSCFYGVLLAGGVPVPIYPPFRADRIEEYAARQAAILQNAEARILVTFRQAEAVARLLQPQVKSLKSVVTGERLLSEAAKGAESQSPGRALYRPSGDDLALIQYTSGSTGAPKGVALTHANLLANLRGMVEAVAVRSTDVAVSWLPLYHDMGLIGTWLTPLAFGIPLAVMSPLAFLTRPERWLWAIHHHRGTITAAPNFAYELCTRKIADRDIEGLDLSSWRAAMNGAEPIHPETLERFAERFARYGFRREAMIPVYGLAEASLAVAVPPLGRGPLVDHIERETFQRTGRALPARPDDPAALAFVCEGRPVPDIEVRIVDERGREVPERAEGRLWFRGPSATRGYYRNPEASSGILRGDGWVDSGDLAYRADGEIYITGRVKDIIIKAGRNIYPHEVEQVTSEVAGVRKGCVVAFGATDERSGTERLVVVAEMRERHPNRDTRARLATEIIARIDETLGLPPDTVELLPAGSIPKTSSGKLRRTETKRLYLAGKLGKRVAPVWVQVARMGAASGAKRAAGGLRRALELLYGAWGYAAFTAFLLPTWLLAKLAPSRRAACRVTQLGTRAFFRLIGCRIRVVGKDRLRDDLPCVFVSNHTSFLDVILYLATMKMTYRFVSKQEIASWPFIGTFLNRREDFRFDREDPAKRLEQAEQLEAALRSGDSLLIFPEGTFVAADGLRPFQLGAFKAAVATGRPVCPIALRGPRKILRDETHVLRPGSITITICPPIYPRTGPGVVAWQEMVRLRDAARAAIAEHCGEPVL